LKGKSVGSGENVLIVEDEDEWRKIYERAVSSQLPERTVKVAKDLTGAQRLIDSTKFAVAFVDVGLDIADDQNVDGLRVMEKLRDTGDKTSIVVVTGRSGQDVLPITRDAIKKYGAYDTVGKGSVSPSEIRRLLTGGLQAYREATVSSRMDARNSIRGTAGEGVWDYQVIQAIGFAGDAGEFYSFLDQLFGKYLPLVAAMGGEQLNVDAERRFVYGKYWSRAITEGLLIAFGAASSFEEVLRAIPEEASGLADHGNRTPINEVTGPGVRGAVYVVADSRRDEFRSI
jgi:ActR/RegA family two-component response regulator